MIYYIVRKLANTILGVKKVDYYLSVLNMNSLPVLLLFMMYDELIVMFEEEIWNLPVI